MTGTRHRPHPLSGHRPGSGIAGGRRAGAAIRRRTRARGFNGPRQEYPSNSRFQAGDTPCVSCRAPRFSNFRCNHAALTRSSPAQAFKPIPIGSIEYWGHPTSAPARPGTAADQPPGAVLAGRASIRCDRWRRRVRLPSTPPRSQHQCLSASPLALCALRPCSTN